MKTDLKKKNNEGVSNLITFIGISFIIVGVIFGMSNIMEHAGKAFFLCLTGTILTFVGNYMKNGYLKFFN